MLFRTLWVVDAVIALGFLAFFVIGLQDGSVSLDNLGLWVAILAALAAVLIASQRLHAAGSGVGATLVAATLAVPGLGMALVFVTMLLTNPRWN